jgi:hypothetical protein
MDVFVVVKAYFTGAADYSTVKEVCASLEIAESVAAGIMSDSSRGVCINCFITKFTLKEFV